MKEGRGESDEADQIRDSSEGLWWQMAEDEKERVRRLSADLYTLEPDSPIQHPEGGGILSDEMWIALKDLLRNKDWSGVLSLLHSEPGQISADFAAYYRGRCWAELGVNAAAIEFLRVAGERRPDFAVAILQPLLREGRVDDAASLARQLLPAVDAMIPNSVFLLANYCGLIATKVSRDERNQWLRQTATTFERALERADQHRQTGFEEEAMPGEYTGLGFCYQMLGQVEEARAACEKALQLDPEHPNALILHGLILEGWPAKEESSEGSKEIERGFWNALAAQAETLPLYPSMLAT